MQEALLVVHILAVCLWIGGSVMNGILNMGVEKAGSAEASAAIARAGNKLGLQFYMPMAIITLLTGVGLVLGSDDAFSFGDPWVSFGFLAIIVAAVLGPLKFQPLSDKITAAYESGDMEAAKPHVKQIAMFSMINTVLLVIAVVLMVFKP